MNHRRINRISEEIRRELSDLIQNKLKDPRIPDITSVSYVDVTNDLSYATVGISILGDEELKQDALEGLNSAKGFLKKELGRDIKLRVMPELIFKIDDSIERGMELQKLIEEVRAEDEDA